MRCTTLKDKLASDRFVITAEIAPPVSCDAADLMAKAAPLKGLADAVNVTDGAGARAHLGAVTAAAILLQDGIEPILQFTCRDRNRIALQSDLMAAAALGIRNLLLLKGDDPKQGDQPDAKPVFDYDTATLTKVAVAHARQGRTADRPQGRRQGAFLHRRGRRADRSAGRLGAEEPARTRSPPAASSCRPSSAWMPAWCGATWRGSPSTACALPFLIGISPLRSAKSARWMREKLYGTIIPDAMIARLESASDPAAEGQQALRRTDARACHHSRRCRRAHHGAGQRGGDRRCDPRRGGHQAGEVLIQSRPGDRPSLRFQQGLRR